MSECTSAAKIPVTYACGTQLDVYELIPVVQSLRDCERPDCRAAFGSDINLGQTRVRYGRQAASLSYAATAS